MLNVVLFEPEIPSNTGAIGRTCVVTGARLHLIRPLGFELTDKALKRAGMAYWKSLNVTVYNSWEDFLVKTQVKDYSKEITPGSAHQINAHAVGDGTQTPSAAPQLHLLTKKAKRIYTQSTYHAGDYLVFGKESAGIPEEILAAHPTSCERIPMLSDQNALVNAPEWMEHTSNLTGETLHRAHPALLQQDICGNFVDPEDYHVSALNLSISAAVVLYEALRQLGYPHMEL